MPVVSKGMAQHEGGIVEGSSKPERGIPVARPWATMTVPIIKSSDGR
jgi:hypothetical protein